MATPPDPRSDSPSGSEQGDSKKADSKKADSKKADSNAPGLQMPTMRPGWWAWLLPLLMVMFLWSYTWVGKQQQTQQPTIPYSTFYALVEKGNVEKVTLRGDDVSGELSASEAVGDRAIRSFRTRLPEQDDPGLMPLMRTTGTAVTVDQSEPSPWSQVLWSLLPWVVIIGAWVWLSRRAQKMMTGGGGPLAGMVKQRAKRFEKQEQVDVTFQDVAGLASAKRDLQEIVDFLRHPERFERLGGRLPRGALLVGAPGTGKTLLARAVAGEASVPFFSITGSEFIELFVGVGASRVRDLFEQAKEAAPAIIFIDEIDAVGRSRGTGLGGGNDEREQTLNQLLSEMDGFDRHDRTVVMAATNRPDVLDPALLRPGRFDRRIVVDLPESAARQAILEVHTRDKPLADDVSLEDLASNTPGFSGADLANLANEAALHAVRRGAMHIEAQDFAAAQDKIQLGDPRETRLAPDEKQRVAVHEAGHAVVAHLTPGAEPLRRVSIIPRGMALGATQQTPQADRHLHTKSELEGKLRLLLGGYASEREVLGEVSSGSENDLKRASEIAHKMVAQLGMSEQLGPVYHEHRSDHPFLGARIATDGGISDATVHQIEIEANRLVSDALRDATETIRAERPLLDIMVQALLKNETLEKDELAELLPPAPKASGMRLERHDNVVELAPGKSDNDAVSAP